MDLILWRHAEAEDGQDDLARKLTAKGHKQAEKMAAWLTAHIPETARVLSSPAVRAKQTAQALGCEIEIVESLRPGADVNDLLRAAGWPGEQGSCVVLAGHQPDLGALAAYFLGSAGALSVKKGAVWWFSNSEGGSGREVFLRAVITPRLAG